MTIKRRTLLAFTVVAALGSTRAYGQDASTLLIAQLEEQGYQVVLIESTWLGRIRILASKTGGTREIVLNPHSGEVLRDLWTATVDDDNSGKTASGSSGSGSGGSGSNSGSGSGSGSGRGSGSGGGNSGSGGGDHDDDDDHDDPDDPEDD